MNIIYNTAIVIITVYITVYNTERLIKRTLRMLNNKKAGYMNNLELKFD